MNFDPICVFLIVPWRFDVNHLLLGSVARPRNQLFSIGVANMVHHYLSESEGYVLDSAVSNDYEVDDGTF